MKKKNLDISLTIVKAGKFYKFVYISDMDKFLIWFNNKFGSNDAVNVYEKSTGKFQYQIK